MIVTRSMHPDWRSNTYLVADAEGGTAVFIDAGAPIEPLMSKVQELGVTVTMVLLTHDHHDHTTHMVELEERYDVPVVIAERAVAGDPIGCGSLTLRPMSTPGHCSPHVSWVVERDGAPIAAFTGDALFRGSVGGTMNGGSDGFAELRASVLDGLLALPGDTVLYPGHMDQTTVSEELTSNPFVRAWQGDTSLSDERVEVAGTAATLLLEGPDYDGGSKAWVRFDDGNEAIVGGSMVTRPGVRA